MASAQLQLIDTDRPWKLDRRTVEIGRAGVARAREALAAAATVESVVPSPVDDAPAPHQAAA
jgi:hypothetical protein